MPHEENKMNTTIRYALLTVREARPTRHYYARLDDIEAMLQITESDYKLKTNNVLHELTLVESTKLPSTAQYII